MEKPRKITIMDVAKLSGVSKGTVDRVLHDRGEVSPKSLEKVKKAIKELDFEPNLYASLLATKKAHLVACLIPEHKEGEYWDKIKIGFEKGGETVKSYNMSTEIFFYDQYNPLSFREACNALLASNPSGVILPPLFKTDTHLFAATLSERGIPYIYVDSKLEDNSYFAYFGMPMYQSGYLCAHLLTERCSQKDVNEVLIVRITRDKTRQSDPTLNRRAGFMDYMSEYFPDCEVHNLFINPNDDDEIYSTLDEFFKTHRNIKYVVMFNSRIHLICKYLEENHLKGRRIIGFDNLDKNMIALKSGIISILISQHTEEQTNRAVLALADYILQHKSPEKKDNYMHMDILTKLNLDYY